MSKLKTTSKSSFKKNKKHKYFIFSSGIFASLVVALGWAAANVSNATNNPSISITKGDTTNQALATSTSTSQSLPTFSVSNSVESSGLTADQIKAEDLQKLLMPSSNVQNFSVIILPITEKNINLGYVNFLISVTYLGNNNTNTTDFADATKSNTTSGGSSGGGGTSQSGNYKSDDTGFTFSNYSINNKNPSDNNVFSTAKIENLKNWIVPKTYKFALKSDQDLQNYISNSTITTLTADDVWNNMLDDTDTLPALKTDKNNNASSDNYTSITVSAVDLNGNTATNNQYGLYKVDFSFYNTTPQSWGESYPSEFTNSNSGSSSQGQGGGSSQTQSTSPITITKYFGGFLNASGTRNTVDLNVEQNIRTWVLSTTQSTTAGTTTNNSIFNGATGTSRQQVSSLTASQFSSPKGGTPTLISLLSSGTGLLQSANAQNPTPIVTYSYANNKYNFYDINNPNSSSTTSGTGTQSATGGILKQIQDNKNNIMITGVQANPNNTDGSLQLVLTYSGFSVYSDAVVDNQLYTVTFSAGTFNTTTTASENLILTWKSVDVLSQYGLSSSYDVVNEFNKNKDNAEFVRLFTNQFLDTTSDVQALDRTATIVYGTPPADNPDAEVTSGTTQTDTGWVAGSGVNQSAITVRLTFPNWNGSGTDKIFQQSFVFPYYQYSSSTQATSGKDALTITWNTSQQVMTSNPTWANITPSNLTYSLLVTNSGQYFTSPQTIPFFTSPTITKLDDVTISLLPDDTNGTLTVLVSKNNTNNSALTSTNGYIYSQMFVGFLKTSTTSQLTSYSWLAQDDVSQSLLSIPLSTITKSDVIDLYLKNIALFANGTLTQNNVQIFPDVSDNSLTVEVTLPFYNQEDITTTNAQKTFLTRLTGFINNQYDNESDFKPPKNLTAVISVSIAVILSFVLGSVLFAILLRRARLRNFKNYHNNVLGVKSKTKQEPKTKAKAFKSKKGK